MCRKFKETRINVVFVFAAITRSYSLQYAQDVIFISICYALKQSAIHFSMMIFLKKKRDLTLFTYVPNILCEPFTSMIVHSGAKPTEAK